jgi:hypothetical protein
MADEEWSGHLTFADGTHEPLTSDEAKALWEESERHQAAIAARLPDEEAAIQAMTEAFHRLKDFGWREAIYCPKGGSSFDVIEPGSSGIHRCFYSGEWPNGYWMVGEDEWCGPSHPILFRLDPEKEAERKAKMADAVARYRTGRKA